MPPKIILAHSRSIFTHDLLEAAKPYIAMAKTGLVESTAIANSSTNVSMNSIRHAYSISEIANFVDLKMLDIKSVVLAALENTLARGPVGMITVSCLVEDGTLWQFAEMCHKKKTLAIGVTVLTTMSNEECFARFGASAKKTALRLGKVAKSCGLDGITCAAHELRYLQDAGLLDEKFASVAPGNRPTWATYVEERGRVATPQQMAKWGATYTVVGRAASQNSEPIGAIKLIHEEMAAAA